MVCIYPYEFVNISGKNITFSEKMINLVVRRLNVYVTRERKIQCCVAKRVVFLNGACHGYYGNAG